MSCSVLTERRQLAPMLCQKCLYPGDLAFGTAHRVLARAIGNLVHQVIADVEDRSGHGFCILWGERPELPA